MLQIIPVSVDFGKVIQQRSFDLLFLWIGVEAITAEILWRGWDDIRVVLVIVIIYIKKKNVPCDVTVFAALICLFYTYMGNAYNNNGWEI